MPSEPETEPTNESLEPLETALESLSTNEGRVKALRTILEDCGSNLEKIEELKKKIDLDSENFAEERPDPEDEEVADALALVLGSYIDANPHVSEALRLSSGQVGWRDIEIMKASAQRLVNAHESLGRMAK